MVEPINKAGNKIAIPGQNIDRSRINFPTDIDVTRCTVDFDGTARIFDHCAGVQNDIRGQPLVSKLSLG